MGRRFYQHRFVWFDDAGALRGVSRQFYFRAKGIEFAAGLAWHTDGRRLIISYSVVDSEAWIATVAAAEVLAALEPLARLHSGKPAAGEAAEPLPWHLSAECGTSPQLAERGGTGGRAR
jgi:hypothetical protein